MKLDRETVSSTVGCVPCDLIRSHFVRVGLEPMERVDPLKVWHPHPVHVACTLHRFPLIDITLYLTAPTSALVSLFFFEIRNFLKINYFVFIINIFIDLTKLNITWIINYLIDLFIKIRKWNKIIDYVYNINN